MTVDTLTAELDLKCQRLLDLIRGLGRCVVAFSGGVDSVVVAAAARRALGDDALAVLARSPSLPSGEFEAACQVAAEIGIRLEVIATHELEQAGYRANQGQRCYYCKSELYDQLLARLPRWNATTILNGTNADDLSDYRPGLRAAAERQVLGPLAECGLTKAEVRKLAQHWGLSVWAKPATPCLSSRLAMGVEVSPERLAMIDAGEQVLRRLGLVECRLRFHEGPLARIEVPLAEVARLATPPVRDELTAQLRDLGFRFITLDLEGFRSGSLNPSPLSILGQ